MDTVQLTDEARFALLRAEAEAHTLGHPAAGAAHLLPALLARADGAAIRALRELDVDISALQRAVGRALLRLGRPDEPVLTDASLPAVLDGARAEARAERRETVGADHLLRGIASGEGPARICLDAFGITAARLRPRAVPWEPIPAPVLLRTGKALAGRSPDRWWRSPAWVVFAIFWLVLSYARVNSCTRYDPRSTVDRTKALRDLRRTPTPAPTSDEEDGESEDSGPPFVERVAGPARVVIDGPMPDVTAYGRVRVAGWAADPMATGSAGVDEVAVWAHNPWGGLTPLGPAIHGTARPDLVATLGGSQFAQAGFAFDFDPAALGLEPGWYALSVSARTGERWTIVNTRVRVPNLMPSTPDPPAGGERVRLGGVSFTAFEAYAADVHYADGVDPRLAARVSRWADQAMQRAPTMVGLKPSGTKVDLFLFPSVKAMNEAMLCMEGREPAGNPRDTWYETRGARFRGIFFAPEPRAIDAYILHTIAYEYTHYLVDQASHGFLTSLWFDEGLADAAADQITREHFPEYVDYLRQDRLVRLLDASRSGAVPPFAEMENRYLFARTGDDAEDEERVVRAAATLTIELLTDACGMPEIASAASERRDLSWASAFAKAAGLPLEGLDSVLRDRLAGMEGTALARAVPAGEQQFLVARGFTPRAPWTLILTAPDGTTSRIPVGWSDEQGIVDTSIGTLRSWTPGTWTATLHGEREGHLAITFSVEPARQR